MKQIELYGYKVFENGTILGLNGKPMNFNKTIELSINGNSKAVSYARFVYYAFNRDFDYKNYSYCVKHKDNDITNNNINNLYITNEREHLHRENNMKSKLTDEEIKEIKKLYFIGEEDNKGNGKNNPFKKYSYRKLADKFGVSHNLIKQVVKGKCN